MTSVGMAPYGPGLHQTAERPAPELRSGGKARGAATLEMVLGELVATLKSMPDQLRQAVTDKLWGDIPVTVEEFGFNLNAVAGTPIPAPAQTGGLELITFIVVSVPTGATGVLKLGNVWQFPFPAGVTPLPFVRKLLQPSDVRSLTLAGGGGSAALWLMGEQRPTFGVMAP